MIYKDRTNFLSVMAEFIDMALNVMYFPVHNLMKKDSYNKIILQEISLIQLTNLNSKTE